MGDTVITGTNKPDAGAPPVVTSGGANVHTTTSGVVFKPAVDKNVLKTIPFILRIVCIILAILVWICLGCATYPQNGSGWAWFVAVFGFIICLSFTIIYLLGIPTKVLTQLPWVLIELIIHAIWTLFYFISFCVLIAICQHSYHAVYLVGSAPTMIWSQRTHDSYAAAVFFCLLAAIAHGALAFLFVRAFLAARQTQAKPDVPPTVHAVP